MANNPTIDGVSREFVRVPRIPTDEMRDAGNWHVCDRSVLFQAWEAMIAAALLDADHIVESCKMVEPVYVLAKQTAVDIPGSDHKELGHTLLDGVGVFRSAEKVHSEIAKRGLPLGWVSMTIDQLLPGYMMPDEDLPMRKLAALQSTIAQLQARVAELESGRGEPVAWAVFDNGFIDDHTVVKTVAAEWADRGSEVTPLFTSPPAPVAVVPDGWKLVPIEPTEHMMRVARGLTLQQEKTPSAEYRAMVNAAPACLDATAALNGERK